MVRYISMSAMSACDVTACLQDLNSPNNQVGFSLASPPPSPQLFCSVMYICMSATSACDRTACLQDPNSPNNQVGFSPPTPLSTAGGRSITAGRRRVWTWTPWLKPVQLHPSSLCCWSSNSLQRCYLLCIPSSGGYWPAAFFVTPCYSFLVTVPHCVAGATTPRRDAISSASYPQVCLLLPSL